ncbi:hypothetical protein MTY66_64100 (plasmid) [Mycolicibacterium sp. TY66]|nr:hypothetical protein MTY66_64100 [Mycolicibacterium sp. TY66]BCJ84999.1 hypothetical protein MTY81_63720 [Mycolicibacterium sp. TY81]
MRAGLEALEGSSDLEDFTDWVALFVVTFCAHGAPCGGGARAFDASVTSWGLCM